MALNGIPRHSLILLIFLASFIFIPACRKTLPLPQGLEKIDSPSEIRWNKIFFLDESHGFIIGGQRFDQAAMMITRDGGKNWAFQSFPEIGKGLYGIQGRGDQVWICGFDGHLIFSEDRGYSWTLFQSPSWLPFQDISAGPDSGWILVSGISFRDGNLIYLDRDRQQIRRDSFGVEWRRIQLEESGRGYLAGYGALMISRDHGRNWSYTSLKNDDFRDIHLGEHTVWVCGYTGRVYSSVDKGETWSTGKGDPQILPQRLLCLWFADDERGWVAGEEGHWARTRNGGRSWERLEPFTQNAIRDMVLSPRGGLILVGDGGTIYRMPLDP